MKPSTPEVSAPLARGAVAGARRASGRTVAQAASRLRGDLWGPFDAVAAAAAVLVAHALSPVFLGALLGRATLRIAAAHALFFVLIAYAVGLYDWNVLTRRGLILRRGVFAAAAATVTTLSFHYFVFYQPIGRWITLFTMGFTALFVLLPRYARLAGAAAPAAAAAFRRARAPWWPPPWSPSSRTTLRPTRWSARGGAPPRGTSWKPARPSTWTRSCCRWTRDRPGPDARRAALPAPGLPAAIGGRLPRGRLPLGARRARVGRLAGERRASTPRTTWWRS